MTYRQYALECGDSLLMCWLEHDAKLKRGTRLTLKEVDGMWTVTCAFDITLNEPPLKKWQVGGLA